MAEQNRIKVKIGNSIGTIPEENLEAFKEKFPNAEVIEEKENIELPDPIETIQNEADTAKSILKPISIGDSTNTIPMPTMPTDTMIKDSVSDMAYKPSKAELEENEQVRTQKYAERQLTANVDDAYERIAEQAQPVFERGVAEQVKKNTFDTENKDGKSFFRRLAEFTGNIAPRGGDRTTFHNDAYFENKDFRDYADAMEKLQEAKELIVDTNRGAGFVQGAARKGFDIDTWTSGVSNMLESQNLKSVIDKYESGEELTDSEESLLDAATLSTAVSDLLAKQMSRGYKAGMVTAESIPFMLEMMANPASGFGRSVSKKLAQRAVAKGLGQASTRASKYLGKLGEGATRLTADIVGANLMSLSTGMGRVVGGAFDRQIGHMNYALDQDGALKFTGLSDNDKDFWNALAKSYKSNTITNFSEMLGAYFAPLAGLTGRGLAKFTKNFPKLQKVEDVFKMMKNNDVAKFIKAFDNEAHLSGVFGEFAEEIADGLLQGPLVEEKSLRETAKDVFDKDNLIDTFLGVSFFGGARTALKTIGMAQYGFNLANMYKIKAEEKARASGISEDTWNAEREKIDKLSSSEYKEGGYKELKSLLKGYTTSKDFSKEQKEALFEYAKGLQQAKGISLVTEKARREGVNTYESAQPTIVEVNEGVSTYGEQPQGQQGQEPVMVEPEPVVSDEDRVLEGMGLAGKNLRYHEKKDGKYVPTASIVQVEFLNPTTKQPEVGYLSSESEAVSGNGVSQSIVWVKGKDGNYRQVRMPSSNIHGRVNIQDSKFFSDEANKIQEAVNNANEDAEIINEVIEAEKRKTEYGTPEYDQEVYNSTIKDGKKIKNLTDEQEYVSDKVELGEEAANENILIQKASLEKQLTDLMADIPKAKESLDAEKLRKLQRSVLDINNRLQAVNDIITKRGIQSVASVQQQPAPEGQAPTPEGQVPASEGQAPEGEAPVDNRDRFQVIYDELPRDKNGQVKVKGLTLEQEYAYWRQEEGEEAANNFLQGVYEGLMETLETTQNSFNDATGRKRTPLLNDIKRIKKEMEEVTALSESLGLVMKAPAPKADAAPAIPPKPEEPESPAPESPAPESQKGGEDGIEGKGPAKRVRKPKEKPAPAAPAGQAPKAPVEPQGQAPKAPAAQEPATPAGKEPEGATLPKNIKELRALKGEELKNTLVELAKNGAVEIGTREDNRGRKVQSVKINGSSYSKGILEELFSSIDPNYKPKSSFAQTIADLREIANIPKESKEGEKGGTKPEAKDEPAQGSVADEPAADELLNTEVQFKGKATTLGDVIKAYQDAKEVLDGKKTNALSSIQNINKRNAKGLMNDIRTFLKENNVPETILDTNLNTKRKPKAKAKPDAKPETKPEAKGKEEIKEEESSGEGYDIRTLKDSNGNEKKVVLINDEDGIRRELYWLRRKRSAISEQLSKLTKDRKKKEEQSEEDKKRVKEIVSRRNLLNDILHKRRLEEEIEKLEAEVDENYSEETDNKLMAKDKELERYRETLDARYTNHRGEIEVDIANELSGKGKEKADIEKELKELKDEYDTLVPKDDSGQKGDSNSREDSQIKSLEAQKTNLDEQIVELSKRAKNMGFNKAENGRNGSETLANEYANSAYGKREIAYYDANDGKFEYDVQTRKKNKKEVERDYIAEDIKQEAKSLVGEIGNKKGGKNTQAGETASKMVGDKYLVVRVNKDGIEEFYYGDKKDFKNELFKPIEYSQRLLTRAEKDFLQEDSTIDSYEEFLSAKYQKDNTDATGDRELMAKKSALVTKLRNYISNNGEEIAQRRKASSVTFDKESSKAEKEAKKAEREAKKAAQKDWDDELKRIEKEEKEQAKGEDNEAAVEAAIEATREQINAKYDKILQEAEAEYQKEIENLKGPQKTKATKAFNKKKAEIEKLRGDELSKSMFTSNGVFDAKKAFRVQVSSTGSAGTRRATMSEVKTLSDAITAVFPKGYAKVKVLSDKKFKEQRAKSEASSFHNDNGDVCGFIGKDGVVYINQDKARIDTPLHEIGIHRLVDLAIETGNTDMLETIVKYAKSAPQEVIEEVKALYPHLDPKKETFWEEVAARAFGLQNEGRLEALLQTEEQKTWWKKFVEAVKKLWNKIAKTVPMYKDMSLYQGLSRFGHEEIGNRLFDMLTSEGVINLGEVWSNEGTIARDMFVGEKAGIETENLSVAREMEAQGKDALSIKIATGWEKGADGKWRYELPDLKIKESWFDEISNMSSEERKDKVYSIDEVFEDNEELALLKEKYGDRVNTLKISAYNDSLFDIFNGTRGYYNPALNKMMLNPDKFMGKATYNDMKSTMVHEIQHLIQTEEGFASGGNRNTIKNDPDLIKLEKRKSDTDGEIKDKQEELASNEEYIQKQKELDNIKYTKEYLDYKEKKSDNEKERKEIKDEIDILDNEIKELENNYTSAFALLEKYVMKGGFENWKILRDVGFRMWISIIDKIDGIDINTVDLGKATKSILSRIESQGDYGEIINQVSEQLNIVTGYIDNYRKLKDKKESLEERDTALWLDYLSMEFKGERFRNDNREEQRAKEEEIKSIEDKIGLTELRNQSKELGTLIEDYKFLLYRKIAGETESRNTSTRMDFTPEQRRNTLAESTEDTPRDQQIIFFDEDKSSSGEFNNFTENNNYGSNNTEIGQESGYSEANNLSNERGVSGSIEYSPTISWGRRSISSERVDGELQVQGTTANISDNRGVYRNDNNVAQQVSDADAKITEILEKKGVKHTSQKVRLASSQEFHDAIAQEKQQNKNGWMVDVHSVEDYDNDLCMLTEDGKAGIAVTPEGDIISVFSSVKGDRRLEKLMQMAIAAGGRKLDCYFLEDNRGLPMLYSRYGFEIASVTPFNADYAPEEYKSWAEENSDRSISGVAAMYLNVPTDNTIDSYNSLREPTKNYPTFEGENGYDEMLSYRDRILEESQAQYGSSNTSQPSIQELPNTDELINGFLTRKGEERMQKVSNSVSVVEAALMEPDCPTSAHPAAWISYLKSKGAIDTKSTEGIGEIMYRYLSSKNSLSVITRDRLLKANQESALEELPFFKSLKRYFREFGENAKTLTYNAITWIADADFAASRLQEGLKEKLGIDKIDTNSDFYMLHNTESARVEAKMDYFHKNIGDKLKEAYRKFEAYRNSFINNEKINFNGVKSVRAAVDRYLFALHAPERNRTINIQNLVDAAMESSFAKKISGRKGMSVGDLRSLVTEWVTSVYDNHFSGTTSIVKLSDIIDPKWKNEAEKLEIYMESLSPKEVAKGKERVTFESVRENNNQSGENLSDSEAYEYINEFESIVLKEDIDALIEARNLATDYILDQALRTELITQETYDYYKSMYGNYIPLRNWDNDEASLAHKRHNQNYYKGVGSVTGEAEIEKKASGRRTAAASPLGTLIAEAQDTIVRGEKNASLKALVNLYNDNIGELTDMMYLSETEDIDKDDYAPDWVKEMTKMNMVEGEEHTIGVKDNGIRKKLYFFGSNGKTLASAYKNLQDMNSKMNKVKEDGSWWNPYNWYPAAMNGVSALTKYMSRMLTTYSPKFWLTSNMPRDVRGGSRNMFIYRDAEYVKDMMKNLGGSIVEIWDSRFNGVNSPEYQLYLDNGGKISFYKQFSNEDIIAKAKEEAKAYVDRGMKKEKAIMKAIGNKVTDLASITEEMMRYSSFKTAIQHGENPAEAAYLAHQVTTNLARRGTQRNFSRFYSFFNPTVQGLYQMITDLANPNTRGRAAAAYGATIALTIPSVMLNKWIIAMMYNNWLDDDDEEIEAEERERLQERKEGREKVGVFDKNNPYWDIPEYIRSNATIIPIGIDKNGLPRVITIQKPHNYRIVSAITEYAIESAVGKTTTSEFVNKSLKRIFNEMSPFRTGGFEEGYLQGIAQAATPTVAQHFVDIMFNTSSFGEKIHRDEYDSSVPEYLMAKGSSPEAYVEFSKWLNKKGGGSAGIRGNNLQINPDDMKYIVDAYFGDAAKLLHGTMNTISRNDAEKERYGNSFAPLYNSIFWQNRDGAMYQSVEELKEYTNNRIENLLKEQYPERVKEYINDEETMAEVVNTVTLIANSYFKEYNDAVKKLEYGWNVALEDTSYDSLDEQNETLITILDGLVELNTEIGNRFEDEVDKALIEIEEVHKQKK